MKPNKILNSLTALALLGGVFSAAAGSHAVKVCAESEPQTAATDPASYGFDKNAIVASSEDFKITVQSSTSTETSHAFTLNFLSTIVTHSSSTDPYKNVHVATNDPECPADKTLNDLTVQYSFDPADLQKTGTTRKNALNMLVLDDNGEPVMNDDGTYQFKVEENGATYDYKFKIPVYEGYVFYLVPSDAQKTVVIPNYINRSNRYMIHVTSIAENIFNYRQQKDGTWKNNYKPALKNIVVGENIASVGAEAFKGITSSDATIRFVGAQSSYTFGEDWSGQANVVYSYDLDNLQTDAEDDKLTDSVIRGLKKHYDTSVATDSEGNTLYFDNVGRSISATGEYLDEQGNVILDDNGDPKKYDGIPQTSPNATAQNFPMKTENSSKSTFLLGDEANNRPLVLEYKFTTKDDSTPKVGYYEFPYDGNNGVGANMPAKIIKYVDIQTESGVKIDAESLVMRNIFEGKRNEDGSFSAVLTSEYQCNLDKGYRNEYSIDQFVKFGKQSVRKYGQYTAFSVVVDKVADIYPLLNPSSWGQYSSKVASGAMKIRYSFTGFNASTYNISFRKGDSIVTKEVSFNDSAEKGLTLNFHLLQKDEGNVVTFLIKNSLVDKDFNADTVTRLEYKDLALKLDLMNTKKGTTQVVTKSDVVTRFGYVDILSKDTNAKVFDADTFLLIMGIIYVAVYLLVATGYYFFAKNKYKNDEFRRMNTKKYLKEVGIGFIGGAIIYFALLFIILRFGFFNVSVIVFNPLDALVMVFGVVGLIVLGLFIKKLVTIIKVGKERRKAIKLKLNEDVADDGTK